MALMLFSFCWLLPLPFLPLSIRHPMYSGGVLMILATPLALCSLWGFVCAVLLCGIIAARLLDEQRYLSRDLPGYEG